MFHGHISTDVIRSALRKNNVTVEEVDVGFDYTQFIAGRLDAQWGFRTTAGLTLPAQGVPVHEISLSDYGVETHGHTVIVAARTIADRPDLVRAFTAAVVEATDSVVANREKAIKATMSRDPLLSRAVAEQQYDIYRTVILANRATGWISPSLLEQTRDRLIEQDLLPQGFDLQTLVDTSFVTAAHVNP